MMEPEAAVSALVFHHPHVRYFAPGKSRAQEPREVRRRRR